MKANFNDHIIFEPRSINEVVFVYENYLCELYKGRRLDIIRDATMQFERGIVDGKIKMQLHEFCLVFGKEMYNGSLFLTDTNFEIIPCV